MNNWKSVGDLRTWKVRGGTWVTVTSVNWTQACLISRIPPLNDRSDHRSLCSVKEKEFYMRSLSISRYLPPLTETRSLLTTRFQLIPHSLGYFFVHHLIGFFITLPVF